MSGPQSNGPAGDAESRILHHEQRLADAIAEFLDRQADEENVDMEEFCRRHADLPELASELRALQTLEGNNSLGEPPGAGLQAPASLSGHRILGRIGSGGMGVVYLAEDARLGRKVAIKTLGARFRKDEQVRRRFMQEARAVARLSHPNIVHIYNLGRDDEEPHFVMEYLEGTALTQAAQALTLHQKAELIQKVVLAVQFLHQNNIIHRDLKPGNILVGVDLEPKLLDFGLALQVQETRRITHAGEVLGTPNYFSPEHVRGDVTLDARSDVFCLGVLLYELLTGSIPFRADTLPELTRKIREEPPTLPRRINTAVPGELQNICMKALEKDPAHRYASAQEMADDLERFLAGERVLAAPTVYTTLMAGRIEQHLVELEGWRRDHIISDHEFDSLSKGYGRLAEREDAWIMQVRRLSLSQVSLYLGAWVMVIGAVLIFLFRYRGLGGQAEMAVVGAAAGFTGLYGIRYWKEERKRIAIAYLLAFCLLLPVLLLVGMNTYGVLTQVSPERVDWELFPRDDSEVKPITLAQMWWAVFVSLPVYFWLRRFTRSSVFSLVFALMAAVLSQVTLFRMGLLERVDANAGWYFWRLIPIALLYFAMAFALERLRLDGDSRYFYPFAVFFSLLALSGLAGYDRDLREAMETAFAWTGGRHEYLFILNAGIYYSLHIFCGALHTLQTRTVSKVFRFVIPGHVMTSLLLLGLDASERWQNSGGDIALRNEARLFEFLLPAVACLFVFFSVPRQMKNYLATGLLFLAVGIIRLQQEYFKDRAEWPFVLLAVGLFIMLLAARYPAVRLALRRWQRQLVRRAS